MVSEHTKEKMEHVLEHRYLELLIVALTLADVILVATEASVDAHLVCINGAVVPFGSPAGAHHVEDLSKVHHPILTFAQSVFYDPLSLVSKVGKAATSGVPGTGVRRRARRLGQDAFLATGSSHEPHGKAAVEGGHGEGHEAHGEGHAHGPPKELLVCETREGHNAHHLVHQCHFWSIVILLVFFVELSLKWCIIENFMASFYHKLDYFVVTVSLIIDTVVMAYIQSNIKAVETAEIVMGLLILSRLWRVVRIAHGIFEEYHVVAETLQEGKEAQKENEKLKKALSDMGANPEAVIRRN